ncbi:hypothetical protein [Mesorhizobium temperatum]|nr:hypothetical protein [Mesorhizobium temperatum]
MTHRPHWLKPSAVVDLRLVELGIRPAFRTETNAPVNDADIGRWARRRSLYFCRDAQDFVVFAKTPLLVRYIMTIDRSPGDHVARLGHWLGYPACCIRSARRITESNLDLWSERVAARRHIGNYACTKTGGYRAGRAMISHIPCSPHCRASLVMATKVSERHRTVSARPWAARN